ncbi:sulfite reductase flavoprotein subunit alpha [Piscinibacter sp. XHJ-5]|uniref:sulfite reductase subunit alpha n=1 Tax=Piscinibacter sp. XHJ-5 TaxID=3037797 RepID=UPI002452BE64|nr:sulfite reductase flavoprotein subunit alpha [Piscinibacter sp. XHJ-5]
MTRWIAAVLVVAAYAALCIAAMRAHRRRRASAAPDDDEHVIVAYGSQTGFAEQLARHAARSLHGAGVPARVMALSDLSTKALERARRALFVVSTSGEGDPPDNAVLFARRLLGADLALSGLRYGMLALGDRSYARYCGFGRSVDGWLRERGAQPMFERLDVDSGDEAALRTWHQRLGDLAGTDVGHAWDAGEFAPWRLVERRWLNRGSAGGAVFHLELQPDGGRSWQAGDLLQVVAPGDPLRPRDYSIASVPSDGRVHLLVRQQRHADGTLGVASGWLTRDAAIGSEVRARLRPNDGFRIAGNEARPLILIGNGTGLAGLRAHLKARPSGRHWMIFGERNAAHDFLHRAEIEAWRERKVVERLDLVFSRDQAPRRYVQHVLVESARDVRRWLADGAAVYVCGSRDGMAAGVHAALIEVAGANAVEQLLQEGRYRRDVY